ncbi:MAG: radical SAM protein [Pseudomonadota bacterium]
MIHRSYHNFHARLREGAARRGIPLRVMFELTYRCNFRCGHCYVPEGFKRRPELSTGEVFSLLDQLRDAGCLYLGFTGGEPLLREDIFDIMWHAKRRGFQLILYTNGSLIDARAAREFARLNPNKIDITLPAMSRTAFEKIAGVRGAREKVFSAVKNLHRKGVKLGFKTCLLKENEIEIDDVRAFASSLGALHRLDDTLSPRLDGSMEPYKYRGSLSLDGNVSEPGCHREEPAGRRGDPLETVVSTGLPRRFAPRNDISHRKRPAKLFRCGAGERQAAITPDGKLKMCVLIDYPRYDILGKRFRRGWMRLRKLTRDAERSKGCGCSRCRLEPYCKRCPAMGWLHAKDFSACDPASRERALKRMRRYENGN